MTVSNREVGREAGMCGRKKTIKRLGVRLCQAYFYYNLLPLQLIHSHKTQLIPMRLNSVLRELGFWVIFWEKQPIHKGIVCL